jgi:ubiquitin C-terminal hydrolase
LPAVPPLSKFFLDKEFFLKLDIKSRMRGTLALSFSQLIFKVHESVQVDAQQAVSPAALKERVCKFAPQFIGSNQQDCQEFLIFFIDGLCEDLHCEPDLSELILDNTIQQSKYKKLAREAWVTHLQTWGNGAIHQLFRGQFQSRITCMECLNDSFTYDPFLDLSLPIPHDGSQGCSLIDCLKAFTATEVLDQAEAYFCEHCKAHRQAAVQLSLRRCPPIVCIQIKRFSYTEVSREKLETPLDVPELGLDFAPFMALDENETAKDDYIYDLHAISQHSGGLGGGHYTAVVKGREQWFVCDDSVVRPAADDGSEFSGSSPYVLFYVRRGYSMEET